MTSPSSAEPPLGAYPDSADSDLVGWHRLHPLTPVVRAGSRLLSVIVVLAGISLLNQGQDKGQLVADLVVIALALSGGFISWLVTRWQVADGVLRIETGLLRRDSRRFPLTQIQAIDVVQTGIARVLGWRNCSCGWPAAARLAAAGWPACGSPTPSDCAVSCSRSPRPWLTRPWLNAR